MESVRGGGNVDWLHLRKSETWYVTLGKEVDVTMEDYGLSWVNPLFLCPVSLAAMLNCQRVSCENVGSLRRLSPPNDDKQHQKWDS